VAIQPDRKVLVAGEFSPKGLIRLNPDGTVDAGFDPELDFLDLPRVVNSIALQPDGKIVVGGFFFGRIARLNQDGGRDSSFNQEACGNYPNAVGLQPDGKILIGGDAMCRLNPDGTRDLAFNTVANGDVLSLALQADGKIVIGGRFSTLNGQARNHLGRLNSDGTLDGGFNPAADDSVLSLAAQADGKILVAGYFTNLAGQPRASTGRLNSDGTLDLGFDPGVSGQVLAMAVQPDGKILAGGSFISAGGQPPTSVARLNNTDPATEQLTTDGSTITWLRGGTSPEVWFTSFDASTNGTDWVELGAGTRISGGWQLAGLSLRSNITIRARGYVSAGSQNGSAWLVETVIGSPGILFQPNSLTACAGTTAAIEVVAGGTAPLTFQWWRDGTMLCDGGNISGASTSILNLASLLLSDEGSYSVVISNAQGRLTSAVAQLTVLPPSQWRARDSGTTNNLRQAIYAQGRYVVMGNSGSILNSSNGVNWSSMDSGTTNNLHGVCNGYGDVAVGSAGTILASGYSGVDWLNRTNPVSGTAVRLFGAAFGAGTYVAVGDSGVVLTSPNDVIWTSQSSGTTADLHAIIYAATQFVVVGHSGVILTSPDGTNWTGRNSGFGALIEGVCYGAGKFVAVGDNARVLTSTDAATWTNYPAIPGDSAPNLNGVAYGNGLFIAAGDHTYGKGTILASVDGLVWHPFNSDVTRNFRAVTYADASFLIVGNGGTILQSENFAPARLTSRGNVSGGFEFVVTGESSRPYRLQSSTNLTAWTDLSSLSNSQRTTLLLDSHASEHPKRYYRAVTP